MWDGGFFKYVVRVDLSQATHLAPEELICPTGVDLLGNRINDVDLEHLKDPKALQSLELGGTKVTDAGLEQLHSRLRLACEPLPPAARTARESGCSRMQGWPSGEGARRCASSHAAASANESRVA